MKTNHIFPILTIATMLGTALSLSSCHKRVGPTSIKVIDPVRHYYPIVQGEDLRMNYLIINTGKEPFIIADIQPASLAVELSKKAPALIPRGDSVHLGLIYHSDPNIGYAEHKIRIFGNVETVNDTLSQGVVTLTFDVHIVRPTLDMSDYEERYTAKRPKNELLVDGTRGEQGYYTDEDVIENADEFYPNNHRDRQVNQTLKKTHLK